VVVGGSVVVVGGSVVVVVDVDVVVDDVFDAASRPSPEADVQADAPTASASAAATSRREEDARKGEVRLIVRRVRRSSMGTRSLASESFFRFVQFRP